MTASALPKHQRGHIAKRPTLGNHHRTAAILGPSRQCGFRSVENMTPFDHEGANTSILIKVIP